MNRFGIRMEYSPEEFHFSRGSGESKIEEVHTFGEFKKSEYMLFFPMMIRDYHERFADDELAKSVYPEMEQALSGQPVEEGGLIAFSGDELSVKRGYPQYPFSSQNAALYVQAALFTAKVAAMLGRHDDEKRIRAQAEIIRAATEKHFWRTEGYYAYSVDGKGKVDSRLNLYAQALPFFYGMLDGNEPRLQEMVANALKRNVFPGGNVSTLPIEGQTLGESNGNTIGLLLLLLSLAKHSDAEKVFKKMLATSGTMATSGEYLLVSEAGISRGEMLRPGESSFNLCAALEFLRAS
jgi:hypothetical protein